MGLYALVQVLAIVNKPLSYIVKYAAEPTVLPEIRVLQLQNIYIEYIKAMVIRSQRT